MIKTSNLKSLHQLDLFQVMSNIIASLRDADHETLQIESLYDELTAKFKAFDEAIIQSRKTGLTTPLSTLDNERDKLFIGFSQYLKGCQVIPDESKQKAANELISIIEKYPSCQALPVREETAAITNLLQDLSTVKQQANLEKIGAELFVKMLEQKNLDFEEMYVNRTQLESRIELRIAKKTRTELELAFRKLVRAVNGLIEVNGETTYKVYTDQINREIDRALAAVKVSTAARTKRKLKQKP